MFDKFHKNYKRDKTADDCIKKNVKELNKKKGEKFAENAEKLHRAIQTKKEIQEDIRDQRKELDEKYREKKK